jgi:hypothetical protein
MHQACEVLRSGAAGAGGRFDEIAEKVCKARLICVKVKRRALPKDRWRSQFEFAP